MSITQEKGRSPICDTDAVAGDRKRDYGLIAEEVAEVFSDLVTYHAGGEAQTVRYEQLVPLLLNEIQQQHGRIEQQNGRIVEQQQQIQEQRENTLVLADKFQAQGKQLVELQAQVAGWRATIRS